MSRKNNERMQMETVKNKETEKQQVAQVAGILCPVCAYKMRVYRTKKLDGSIVRERICDRCGEKRDTEEVVY